VVRWKIQAEEAKRRTRAREACKRVPITRRANKRVYSSASRPATQKREAENARSEVEKATGKVYLTIGGIIPGTDKEKR